MRSPHELWFRFRQELTDLALFALPPACRVDAAAPLPGLPAPAAVAERLRGTPFALEVEHLAGDILAHRFPALGLCLSTGPDIRWRRDYASGLESPAHYFRRIPYLDPSRVGDHKIVWELNRHQHLTVLAQAFLLTGRTEFRDEIPRQLESWWAANPFLRGINWTSALEVAFRALSWIWVYHFAGATFTEEFRRRFLNELYRHGVFLRHNLSVYFSPNTHLLGEAVALHALGRLFPAFPGARDWQNLGRSLVLQAMERQVRDDGSHFEQSAYYQVYALDFFLLHAILEPPPSFYAEKLARMAGYLDALLGSARRLPLIGDDDGGRLFHPYGPCDEHGRASLATAALLLRRDDWAYEERDLAPQAAWWLGERAFARPPDPPRSRSSCFFPDAGLAVMAAGDAQVIVDAGPFGGGSAGHSHSDTLSVLARAGGRDLLIDPATFTYLGDPVWRNWFRGSAAHNTLRIDGADQAEPANPFRWHNPPAVELRSWQSAPGRDELDAVCRYSGFTHRRRVIFHHPDLLFVFDDIDGPSGEHEIEQFWHLGAPASRLSPACFQIGPAARLLFLPETDLEYAEGGIHGWRSPAYGVKCPSPVLIARARRALPLSLAACLSWRETDPPVSLRWAGPHALLAETVSGECVTAHVTEPK